MDHSEQQVRQYLLSLGEGPIVYEPNGNIPPDFLLGKNIAIEVRRLNQNYDDGSGTGVSGLEEQGIPLRKKLNQYFASQGTSSNYGESWLVFYSYSRPVLAWKHVERELAKVVQDFLANRNQSQQSVRLKVSGQIEVNLFRSSIIKPNLFHVIGDSDEQRGGFLVDILQKNLVHCIAEKSLKISAHRARYPEWWLIMPDHVGYALDDDERAVFREQVPISCGDFDRVILIDPHNPLRVLLEYRR